MDVTSYLLGKQAGGGSTPTLQSKSVTITENGTTNVTADEGYDGLSNVSVTTNVSGGGVDEYFFDSVGSGTTQLNLKEIIKKTPPLTINTTNCSYGFSYYKGTSVGTLSFTNNPTNTAYMFQSATELLEAPLFNTSSVTDAYGMFSGCSKLTTVPNYDFSNATRVYTMFASCTNLTTVPTLNFVKAAHVNELFNSCSKLETAPNMNIPLATSFNGTFANCYALKNVPVYDWSSIKTASNAFMNCYNLTNTSLDNILQSCISATSYTGTKTLSSLGISSSTSTIQSLPHYQDFIDAGWTIS